MLDKLTQEDFAKHLNQRFRLRSEAGELQLELIEAVAVDTAGKRPDGQRAPFSLLFRGPKDVLLPQMIYDLEHQDMGSLGLFLVPIGPDEDGMRLDRWFKVHYPELAHGRLQKLLRTGQVRVDGARSRANTRLESGQTVRIPPLPDTRDEGGERPRRVLSLEDAEWVRSHVDVRFGSNGQ